MFLSTTTSGSGARHVALVHGLGANGETWQPLVDRMLATGDYTITTVDLRGHGTSARAKPYSIDALADDLVESLPRGLHSVVGHSLGGAVVAQAITRLAPSRAVYLDPGFHLALPTSGLRGRLFWLVPALSLVVAQVGQAREGAKIRALYSPEVRKLIDRANKQFDRSAAIDIFRDVAFHPLRVARPEVPSTVVLSDDSPAVVPDNLADALGSHDWDVRRLPGIHHDMHLEDPERVFNAISDVL